MTRRRQASERCRKIARQRDPDEDIGNSASHYEME